MGNAVDINTLFPPEQAAGGPMVLLPGMNESPHMWQPKIREGTLMPRCHDENLMRLMIERYMRDDAALAEWAEPAKKCFDHVEGRHWTAAEVQAAEEEDRPLITLNKTAALIRLVLGYHRNNRLDTRYLPANDAAATEAVGTVLTQLIKSLAQQNGEPYVDTEVFLDGIVGGRGYYDWRLSFEHNDLGEIKGTAKDPFTIRPDADSDTYDTQEWGHFIEARWTNLDEVEYLFGKAVTALISPLVKSSAYRGGIPSEVLDYASEHTPWRTFGGGQDNYAGYGGGYGGFDAYLANTVDPYRKNIRIIEMQHKVRVMQRHLVDLETGDRQPIPDNFGNDKVAKIMQWCAEQYAMRGQPCPIRQQWRPNKRVRWTVMIGDIIVYDEWSPYRSYTLTGFYPYFRRGVTRGMGQDLIGPARELNLRRSSQIDILTRVAHSGWMWHKDGLEEGEKEKIEMHGGAPGLNLEWKGSVEMKPARIEPGQMPTAIKDLETSAALDLKEIAGINDSALGQVDRVQSGRAIENRQRQSVLGIESYMDNMRRTKWLTGRKKLELLQDHITEPRLMRMEGQPGTWSMIGINQAQTNGTILNDITVGKYFVSVDDTPLSDSWMSAQFDELIALIEKGILPIPLVQDIAVDLSSAPQKALIKARLAAYMKAQGFITPDEMIAAQAAGLAIHPGQLPPPQGAMAPGPGAPGAGGEGPLLAGSAAGGGGPPKPKIKPKPASGGGNLKPADGP